MNHLIKSSKSSKCYFFSSGSGSGEGEKADKTDVVYDGREKKTVKTVTEKYEYEYTNPDEDEGEGQHLNNVTNFT